MKKLTCNEVGGACDIAFTGNSLEEIGQQAGKHAMETNDDAHKAKMEEMRVKSDEEKAAFMQEMAQKFENAPEVE